MLNVVSLLKYLLQVEDTIKFLVSIEDQDPDGVQNLVQSQPVTVIVLDENDNPPIFKNVSSSKRDLFVEGDKVEIIMVLLSVYLQASK